MWERMRWRLGALSYEAGEDEPASEDGAADAR